MTTGALHFEGKLDAFQDYVIYSRKTLSHFLEFQAATILRNSPSENTVSALQFGHTQQDV